MTRSAFMCEGMAAAASSRAAAELPNPMKQKHLIQLADMARSAASTEDLQSQPDLRYDKLVGAIADFCALHHRKYDAQTWIDYITKPTTLR